MNGIADSRMPPEPIRVAVVQAAPAYLDIPGTMRIIEHWLNEASAAGAQLVAFGETWLTGYPAWLDHCPNMGMWDHGPTKAVFARLRQSSITVPGPETEQLARWARERGMTIVIGVNERVAIGPGHGTLYNTLLTFTPAAGLANHHRKLRPTYTERLVWGPGDGAGLRAVDTPAGRVGGLICWEHWMPLARQAMHLEAERIHVAVWPTVHERHQLASRHYAFEGRCFVLAAGGIQRAADLPAELEKSAELAAAPDSLVLSGGSAIIGPDGEYLAGPVFDTETLLVADLDPSAIDRELMTLDVTGHYARDDVFRFEVDRGGRPGASDGSIAAEDHNALASKQQFQQPFQVAESAERDGRLLSHEDAKRRFDRDGQ
jgi:predicted amidohydrolase